MNFVSSPLSSIARQSSSFDTDERTGAVGSPASRSLEALPLCEPAETVTMTGFADAPADAAIHSRFAGNIRFSPIVRKFAARLHEQLELAGAAQCSGDLEALARFGHWLAGTAGTVGYDAFTVPGRELQALAERRDAQAAATALVQLTKLAGLLVVPEALVVS
jgi:HPt (histidine-containing phosphotransfer) domain-containing protein